MLQIGEQTKCQRDVFHGKLRSTLKVVRLAYEGAAKAQCHAQGFYKIPQNRGETLHSLGACLLFFSVLDFPTTVTSPVRNES